MILTMFYAGFRQKIGDLKITHEKKYYGLLDTFSEVQRGKLQSINRKLQIYRKT